MPNIVETVKNALLAAFEKRGGRFRSIPKDQLRAYVLNSNPVAKDALSVALDAIPETEEVEYHNKAEDDKRKKMVPPLPKKYGGKDPEVDGDENGLVYVTRTFRIDPKVYSSSNYRPLDDNGNPIVNPQPEKPSANPEEEKAISDLSDNGEDVSVEEKEETEEVIKAEPQKGNAPVPSNKMPEPTEAEEKQAAESADVSAMKEDVSVEGREGRSNDDEEKERRKAEFRKAVGIAEDEMPECEDLGILYGEYGEAVVQDEAVVMDRRASAGGVRRRPTRQNCETTFENCRAKNPLFCRFHGPRLIELDIKKTLQLSGIRGQVSVTRDPSANSPRAFKVTIACRPADRDAVETVLDEFMNEPGITSTSERARGDDGKLTNYYTVDDMENARPRGAMAERIESVNARKVAQEGNTPRRRRPPREEVVEEVQETAETVEMPQTSRGEARAGIQPQEQREEVSAEQTEEVAERPAETDRRAAEPVAQQPVGDTNDIEHFEGGVKARFSPSEKAAIERAKNDAIRDSNANPEDTALRAYAHALSHFLGSQNTRYGRRNHALRGIRDDITKAELLEKAEARLASTADADHPEKYEGTVKALEKIAELSGLGGQIEIDGATVRMRETAQGAGNAAETDNAQVELEDFMQAANARPREETSAEAMMNHPLTDSDLDYAADALVDDGHYENRREARQTLINVLYEAGYDGDRGRRQMINDARDLAIQLRESQNAPRISQNMLARLDRVARMEPPPERNEVEWHRVGRRDRNGVGAVLSEAQRELVEGQGNQDRNAQGTQITFEEFLRSAEAAFPDTNDRDHRHQATYIRNLVDGTGPYAVGGVMHEDRVDQATQYLNLIPSDGHDAVRAALQRVVDGEESTNRNQNGGRSDATRFITLPEPEQVRSAANRISAAVGRDAETIMSEFNDRILGRTPITHREMDFLTTHLGTDDPIVGALRNAFSEQQRLQEERARNNTNNIVIPNPADVTIPTYGAAATPEEIEAARKANRDFWAKVDTTKPEVKRRIMAAASAMCRNNAVAQTDLDTAREALQKPRLEANKTPDEINDGTFLPFASKSGFGCNCWKTVAAAFCRLRGFNVKARGENQASPVFANTKAADGGQKSTFQVSQAAMAKAYERVNGASRAETEANLRRIAEGSTEGHPPTLPYPDGTVVSTWDGGHCTGAVLFKGKWFSINPYYGPSASEAISEGIARQCYNGFSGGYESQYIRTVRNAVEEYNRQKEANPRFHFDAGDERKQHVLHFLAVRQRMKRTNPQVTDEAVYAELPRDTRWLDINGSFVIRPDQPLIKEVFGLAQMYDA